MAADQSAQIRSITYWKEFLGIKVPVFTGSERLAMIAIAGGAAAMKCGFLALALPAIIWLSLAKT